jgi:hypothetical protein
MMLLNTGGMKQRQAKRRKLNFLEFVQLRSSWNLFASLFLNKPEWLGT